VIRATASAEEQDGSSPLKLSRSERVRGLLTRYRFAILIALVGVLACFLRYRDITRQVPLDDEWHSLTRSAVTPLADLATHYYPRATSIPTNVYHRWLLEVWGWSELGLRLPTILSTLGTCVLLPWVALRLFASRWMAFASALLFAVSQFWILYGQSARPYSTFLLLLLAAYYLLERGLSDSSKVWIAWVGFAICGALAVYFHLYALPALASSAVVAAPYAIFKARRAGARWPTALRATLPVVFGYALWTALVLALFAWPLLNGLAKNLPAKEPATEYGLQFWKHSVEILTSTRTPLVAVGLLCASLFGLWSLLRSNPRTVLLLGFSLAATCLFTLVSRPRDFTVAMVMVRYNIVAFLLYYFGLARCLELAVTWVGNRLRHRLQRGSAFAWSALTFALLFSALLVDSPVVRDLRIAPNNFRLHVAFHEYYSDWAPNKPFVSDAVRPAERPLAAYIPPFYAKLAAEPHPCRVLEYPLQIGDDRNPFYFYQMIHGCEVVAGYSSANLIGQALNLSEHGERMRFNRLLNVEDIARVRRKKVQYVIVHLNMLTEVRRLIPGVAERASRQQRNDLRSGEVRRILGRLERELGPPIHQDETMHVFRMPISPGS